MFTGTSETWDATRLAYRPAEIVVALEHLNEVERELSELGVKPDAARATRSSRLGLALLPLTDLDPAVSRLGTDEVCAAEEHSRRHQDIPSDPTGSSLHTLMTVLRHRFARRYAGWIPTIGKNRFVEGLEGLGEIGGGGEGGPKPAGGGPKPTGEIGGGGAGAPRPLAERPSLSPQDSRPGRLVQIGVLDTGMVSHPALVGRFVSDRTPAPFAAPESRPFFTGHATFVAGLILAEAARAELRVDSVLADADGGASAWDAANKIIDFADSDIELLNLSFGCATSDGEPPLILARAIDRLNPDVVVVAAAGNYPPARDGVPDRPLYPAALPGVIGVGAYEERAGRRVPAEFSREQPWVQVMAPGVDVLSTYLDGPVTIARRAPGGAVVEVDRRTFTGAARWSGSSFAAATVTGRIAAGTRPGKTTAREALSGLLTSPAGPTYL